MSCFYQVKYLKKQEAIDFKEIILLLMDIIRKLEEELNKLEVRNEHKD